MINTKKKISEFFANYGQIESTIRSGTVNFNKRTIEICHQDMLDLNFEQVNQDDLIFVAIEHLKDQDFEFDYTPRVNHTSNDSPQDKHSSKVLGKQQAIVETFNNG